MNFNKTIKGKAWLKLNLAMKVYLFQDEEETEVITGRIISPSEFSATKLYDSILANLDKTCIPETGKANISIILDRGMGPNDKLLIDLHILSLMLSKANIRVFINLTKKECLRLTELVNKAQDLKKIKKELFNGDSVFFAEALKFFSPLLSSEAMSVLAKSNIKIPEEQTNKINAGETVISAPEEKEEAAKPIIHLNSDLEPIEPLKAVAVEDDTSYEGKDVLIIDSYNFFHRTFHACGNVVDNNFQPIGLVRSLKNIINYINTVKPDFVVFATEGTKEIDYRKEFYADYKVSREPTEPALSIQIPQCLEIIRRLGFVVIEKRGYEADDVIASYAGEFFKKGANVKIYSSDKDLYQLVENPKDGKGSINVFDWTKKEIITEEHCMKKFGVSFDKCLLVQAIMGDTSDSVPGAMGVGAKKASDLINAYDTIEGIYENIENLTGALKRNIEEQRPQIEISLRLVTLNRNLAEGESLKFFRTPFYENKEFRFNNKTEEVLKSKSA